MRKVIAIAGATIVLAAGCNALLDIDHIEFGDTTSATSEGAGAGSVSSGNAGQGPTSTGVGGAGSGGELGGYPPSPENCANGTDDNSDGLADCADPLCTCAPEAPNNWVGPVVLYTGTLSSTCPDDWPNVIAQGFTSVSADPVTCTACGCGPAAVFCSAPLNFYTTAGCSGSPAATTNTTSLSCVAMASNLYLSASAGVPTVSSSSNCPPTGGMVVTSPPPLFDDHAVVCGGAGLGTSCAGQDSCLPLPPTPFLGKICVYRAQSVNCPNTDYTEKHTFFTQVNDSRGCSGCQCGAVSGASCTASTNLYSAAGCTGTVWTLPNNGSCVGVQSPLSRLFSYTGSGGMCTSTGGGAPVGGVSGDDTVTVCCVP